MAYNKWGWDDGNMEGKGYNKCETCGNIMNNSIGYNPSSKEKYVYSFCKNCNNKLNNECEVK